MIDLKNKIFLDTDGEMTFENKERLNFIMHFMKIGAHHSTLETKDSKFVHQDTETAFLEIWLPCAESKQAEIDSLKAQLAKIESGEFVVVPKIELMTVIGNCSDAMTDETTSSIYDTTGEPSTWYDHHIIAENKILAAIEAAQENSHE